MLTDEILGIVNNAFTSGQSGSFAYAGDTVLPNLSFYGAVQARSETQLAICIRNPQRHHLSQSHARGQQ